MKTKNANLIYGVLIAVALIAVYLLLSYTSLKDNTAAYFLPTIVLIVLAALNVINYNRLANENLSFGNAFAYGFKTIALVAVIMICYTLFSITVLFPELKQKAYEAAVTALQADGNTLPADIKKIARENVDKSYIIVNISGALISTIFMGSLGSLIGAAFVNMKNKNVSNN